MAKIKQEICPMCTQAMAFSSSLNSQLNSSIIITKKKDTDISFLNIFVSTKETPEKKPENIGGTAYEIHYCPWCGRKLKDESASE